MDLLAIGEEADLLARLLRVVAAVIEAVPDETLDFAPSSPELNGDVDRFMSMVEMAELHVNHRVALLGLVVAFSPRPALAVPVFVPGPVPAAPTTTPVPVPTIPARMPVPAQIGSVVSRSSGENGLDLGETSMQC